MYSIAYDHDSGLSGGSATGRLDQAVVFQASHAKVGRPPQGGISQFGGRVVRLLILVRVQCKHEGALL